MTTLLESIDGKEYVLEDVSVERVLRLNNDNSVTVKAPYTPHNLDIFHKMDKRWKFYLNDMGDNDYYIVDDITFNAVDNGTDLEFFAISKFNDDLRQDMIYEEHSGSNTALKWVEMIDKWSKYNVRLGVDGLHAISIESFGLFSVREGLEIICNKYDLEFYLNKSSNTIVLTRTVGNVLDDYVKYEVNLGDVTKSMNFTDFSTYGKGYGAFKDPDKPELGRYETEYTSPLASIYGKLPITPVSDERFTILDNLKTEIKNRVDNSIVESIEIDVDDLYMFKHTNISVGDSLPMIDPRLDFHKDVRVFEIVEQWNEQNELTDIEYTLNNYSEAYRQMVSEGGMEHRLTTQFEESVSDMGHFVKDLEADISAEMEKMYNDLSGQFTQGLDGLTRIYRQATAPSPIKDIPVNSLWYKPVKNPTGVQPEYDVEMYGMVEGAGGVKSWQLLSDRNSRDASRLNVGTLDASVINVINLNANSVNTGVIRGRDSYWNLDTGVISFTKGLIQGSNSSWNLDTGVIAFSKGLIKGANSMWNLDTGEMLFTKGAIRSTDAKFELDITKKHLIMNNVFNVPSVPSNRTREYTTSLSDGALQFLNKKDPNYGMIAEVGENEWFSAIYPNYEAPVPHFDISSGMDIEIKSNLFSYNHGMILEGASGSNNRRFSTACCF